MLRYVMLRTSLMALTLAIVVVLTFVVIRLLPGSVAYSRLGETASARDVEEMERILGLDRPWYEQFWEWSAHALVFDFGESLIVPDQSVRGEIGNRLPVTIELAVLAVVAGTVIGIPFGVASAIWQDRWPDYVLRLVALIGLAVPTFWLLTLAITYTALWWGWLPPFGYREVWDDPWGNLQQFALPAAVLGLSLAAPIMRITRSTMLESLRADYIRTARAKGLPGHVVVSRHAMKNALIPVVTVIGLQTGTLLGGTVLIESVAGLPGLGRLAVDAINRRDYPVLQGVVIVTAAFVILSNFVVDVVYVYLDPRTRP